MQLDEGEVVQTAVDVPASVRAQVEAPTRPLPPITLRALGQTVPMIVTSDIHLRDDSHWRLRSIYEPFLAAQTLAIKGVALDVGAGFGCFAIPFALGNPCWTVWAFEPEPEAFAALCQNIRAQNLTNVFAINAAVAGPTGTEHRATLALTLAALAEAGPNDAPAMTALHDALPRQDFRQHVDMRGVVERNPAVPPEFIARSYACVPSEALLVLEPTLLKLTAPFAETDVLSGLQEAPLDHVTGESWTHLSSDLVFGKSKGLRQTWIPRAGDPLLRLRRSVSLNGHRDGLDVVVAMYNARTWIKDCIDGILQEAGSDIRALVVDDGSTDGSGDLVREIYAGNDQVVLLSKLNGGCASARNYGRLNSDATHIAFVDADDVPGPGLFSGLLELARHTGSELVQGGFELLHQDPSGEQRLEKTYESGLREIVEAVRHPFGDRACFLVPTWLLIQGQPTIWRRVYRRDYLDNRNIWFPEHIRAFDDQIFQLLTLQHVQDVPMLDGVAYHYRQHDGQDIKQGDERSFYSLEMFRMMLKRGMTEGWNDFRPMLRSFVNTVNWCWSGLRPDLRPAFEKGAAELWVYAQNTLGAQTFRDLPNEAFSPPDFAYYVRTLRAKLKPLDQSLGSIYLDSFEMHTVMMKSVPPQPHGKLAPR
jgi:glycosyltransferase involved in cell wall biosynthesis